MNRPLGKPAGFNDRIVQRRIDILKTIPGFTGRNLDLLDIGCGNGASTFLLAPEMSRCVGIDIRAEYQSTFEDYRNNHKIENCEFHRMDIDGQSYDRTFDRLISFEVIEHLADERSVRFYHTVLKKGGLAAVTVPNKWWVFETHGAHLPVLPWNRVPFFSWLPRPIHEKFAKARIYTKNRILHLLTSVGFEVLRMDYVTAPMDVLPEGRLKSFLTTHTFGRDTTKVPFLATAIFVLARKN